MSNANPAAKAVKPKVATVWLDGCSGCHMSFLDLDEKILVIAEKVDVVFSPVVDPKEFPEHVDLTLIEGAVSTHEEVEKVRMIRQRTRLLVSLGDCAVTGNVPALRNAYSTEELFERAYVENASYPSPEVRRTKLPVLGVPALAKKARPVHEIVKVDLWVPGCPPPPDAIFYVLAEILEGRIPDPSALTRFGR